MNYKTALSLRRRRLDLIDREDGRPIPRSKPAARTAEAGQEPDMRGRKREVITAPNGREVAIYYRNAAERAAIKRAVDRCYPTRRPKEAREEIVVPIEEGAFRPSW